MAKKGCIRCHSKSLVRSGFWICCGDCGEVLYNRVPKAMAIQKYDLGNLKLSAKPSFIRRLQQQFRLALSS